MNHKHLQQKMQILFITVCSYVQLQVSGKEAKKKIMHFT